MSLFDRLLGAIRLGDDELDDDDYDEDDELDEEDDEDEDFEEDKPNKLFNMKFRKKSRDTEYDEEDEMKKRKRRNREDPSFHSEAGRKKLHGMKRKMMRRMKTTRRKMMRRKKKLLAPDVLPRENHPDRANADHSPAEIHLPASHRVVIHLLRVRTHLLDHTLRQRILRQGQQPAEQDTGARVMRSIGRPSSHKSPA